MTIALKVLPETPAAGQHIDPVCGMTVDPARAAGEYEYAGQKYYFCNPHCLHRFRETPEQYLHPAQPADAPAPATPAATYICPMDPEVRQSTPGACPKCGMALEPDLAGPLTKT